MLNRLLDILMPATLRRSRERRLKNAIHQEILQVLKAQDPRQNPAALREAIATEARKAIRNELEQHPAELSSSLLISAALQDVIRSVVLAELAKVTDLPEGAAKASEAFVDAVRDVIDRQGPRNETLKLIDESRHELIRRELNTRRLFAQTLWRLVPPAKQPHLAPTTQNFGELLQALQRLHPTLYPAWERINFSETPAEFSRRPEGSCTLGKRATDLPFSGFVAPYLNGRVLDVGCGPYAMPLYLHGYPIELIYGIDPLEPFEPHPFTFARTFAEFIPFPDNAFETVIAATSLDHTLSLRSALSEIRRVLAPRGNFLIWDGFVKGSPPYDPDDPALQPVDSFHFFHFDEDWFDELMAECGFTVREKLAFDPSPHAPQYCTSFFYCLSAE